MHINASQFSPCFMAIALVTVSACGWVDSTGVQGIEVPSDALSGNARLRNAQPLEILEEMPLVATLSGEDSSLTNWTWASTPIDARNRCAGINGFDSQLATINLYDACTDSSECSISIEEPATDANTDTRFKLRLPQLSAPVALSYELSAARDDGSVATRQQLLCGLSINEAPLAVDDHFLALRGEYRQVNASDPDNLLENDEDDHDVRNQPLHVLTEAVQLPRYAVQFSLGSDGSFYYQPADDAPPNDKGYVEDSFVYSITDGSHEVEATAFIRIVDDNRGPVRLRRIPDMTLTAASDEEQVTIRRFDLSSYFFDPDTDPVKYKMENTQLPASGNVSLDTSGILTIRATLADAGRWRLSVRATDGLDSTTDTFTLSIEEPATLPSLNRPPVATDIPNRQVDDEFGFSVASSFSDPDGDRLVFSAAGLPTSVRISNDGFISGKANRNNSGRWLVQVTADDGRGGQVSDRFLLVID